MSFVPVLVDTREKKPWAFPLDGFAVQRRTLTTGDYSLDGYEDVVSIERKSLGDLVQTVIVNWIRFRKELYRLAGMDHAIIAAECSLSDIAARRYEMEVEPARVMARLHEIVIDHGIPVMFWGDAVFAEQQAAAWLKMVWKRVSGEK